MAYYQKLKMGVADSRIMENTTATAEKTAALLEYVAIMADVELPDDDDETEAEE